MLLIEKMNEMQTHRNSPVSAVEGNAISRSTTVISTGAYLSIICVGDFVVVRKTFSSVLKHLR